MKKPSETRASEGSLDGLHKLIAMLLSNELDRASNRAEMHPDDPAFAISPQLLSQALKFLKDNNISAPASSPRGEDLLGKLAALDLDDEVLSGLTRN